MYNCLEIPYKRTHRWSVTASTVQLKGKREKRGKPIHSPHTYIRLMEQCRPSQPYNISYLTHVFFKDFTKHSYYPSIRPGMRPADPVVTDLCCLMYCPDGRIQYKLRFTDNFDDLTKRTTRMSNHENHEKPAPASASALA